MWLAYTDQNVTSMNDKECLRRQSLGLNSSFWCQLIDSWTSDCTMACLASRLNSEQWEGIIPLHQQYTRLAPQQWDCKVTNLWKVMSLMTLKNRVMHQLMRAHVCTLVWHCDCAISWLLILNIDAWYPYDIAIVLWGFWWRMPACTDSCMHAWRVYMALHHYALIIITIMTYV